MTKEERLEMERANHKTCLLAQTMKDCPNCKFFWVKQEEEINNTVSTQGKEETK